ncbi:MAG: DUF3616 domain-containing protein [Planctomycetes bacterium]|nr:DUF3616 domain-containing protein [Planctomycetota bacterium]
MRKPRALWILLVPAVALSLASAWSCSAAGEAGPAPQAPAAGAGVDLIEASGIAVRGGGKVAVIGGDEAPNRLWAVSLEDRSARWELPFPPGTPMLDDVEDLAPWGKDAVFVTCSQSRTKPSEKAKPQRDRLALVTLSPDARRIADIRVFSGLRYHLLRYLAGPPSSLFADPEAIVQNGPNRGGLNVEGLAAWKGRLLIGLRCPTAKGGGAVVIPLRDPEKLFAGSGQEAPGFDPPIVLPTRPGEGIRAMAEAGDAVLVLLGNEAADPGPGFRLARWDPETNTLKDVEAAGLKDVANPEGIALDPQGRLLVVQDQKAPLPAEILFRLELRAGR